MAKLRGYRSERSGGPSAGYCGNYESLERREERREGGSWPHKIAEGDRGGERGGLFKRGANEYSEERGLRAPR